jgi:hypothetical protein
VDQRLKSHHAGGRAVGGLGAWAVGLEAGGAPGRCRRRDSHAGSGCFRRPSGEPRLGRPPTDSCQRVREPWSRHVEPVEDGQGAPVLLTADDERGHRPRDGGALGSADLATLAEVTTRCSGFPRVGVAVATALACWCAPGGSFGLPRRLKQSTVGHQSGCSRVPASPTPPFRERSKAIGMRWRNPQHAFARFHWQPEPRMGFRHSR